MYRDNKRKIPHCFNIKRLAFQQNKVPYSNLICLLVIRDLNTL